MNYLTKAEITQVLADIDYKRARIELDDPLGFSLGWIIHIQLPVRCTFNGRPNKVNTALEVPRDVTEGQLLNLVLKSLIALETHETTEWFRYKNKRIADPHVYGEGGHISNLETRLSDVKETPCPMRAEQYGRVEYLKEVVYLDEESA